MLTFFYLCYYNSGDPNNYPFDSYKVVYDLSATDDGSSTTLNNTSFQVALSLTGSLQSWSFANEIQQGSNPLFQSVAVIVFRSFTTKFFSLFMIGTMWILSSAILILAVTLWYRDRKVEPPTIAVVTGMLFALPAVRNVQPGIPTVI